MSELQSLLQQVEDKQSQLTARCARALELHSNLTERAGACPLLPSFPASLALLSPWLRLAAAQPHVVTTSVLFASRWWCPWRPQPS